MMTLNSNATSLIVVADDQQWACKLYKHACQLGALRRLWRGLRGRPCALASLVATGSHSAHVLGQQTVAIDAIVGSESRAGDFDCAFAPLVEHTRDRWLSVARARIQGRPLPPVQLIQTIDGYYVRDGHHRISVARALGEEYIEAEVVRWA
jgi:hypothetical protein